MCLLGRGFWGGVRGDIVLFYFMGGEWCEACEGGGGRGGVVGSVVVVVVVSVCMVGSVVGSVVVECDCDYFYHSEVCIYVPLYISVCVCIYT